MFCVTLSCLDELSYTFDHICTNLLTQCTPVPVPVFCYFCISGFLTIKSSPKIPKKKQIKNKCVGTFLCSLGGARGPPLGTQAPWWRAVGLGRARGGAWDPGGPV